MINKLDKTQQRLDRKMDGWLDRWMNGKHIKSSKWLTGHTQTHGCLWALSPGVQNTVRGRHAIHAGL